MCVLFHSDFRHYLKQTNFTWFTWFHFLPRLCGRSPSFAHSYGSARRQLFGQWKDSNSIRFFKDVSTAQLKCIANAMRTAFECVVRAARECLHVQRLTMPFRSLFTLCGAACASGIWESVMWENYENTAITGPAIAWRSRDETTHIFLMEYK